jgi:hypothetical protein
MQRYTVLFPTYLSGFRLMLLTFYFVKLANIFFVLNETNL